MAKIGKRKWQGLKAYLYVRMNEDSGNWKHDSAF
jgi:hypothetical protein